MTSIVSELVPKLRRAIGDNETPYAYNDSILAEYIMDSMEGIEIFYPHDYEIDRTDGTVTPDISTIDQHLFILNAHIDLLNTRSNINFSVGGLSVRRQNSTDSKDDLQNKLKKAINKRKTLEALGKSSTEYDTYARRLEDWLKYITY